MLKNKRTFIPEVVATGGREPPYFAQLLTSTIARVASSDNPAAQADETHDAWIDNIRCLGQDDDTLTRTDERMTKICDFLGVQIGDRQLRQTRYTFLGVVYDHEACTVELSERTRKKLHDITLTPRMTYEDASAAAGITLFAASVVMPESRAPHYFVFKFFRRVLTAASSERQPVDLWNCLLKDTPESASWKSWITQLLACPPR
jgi:hypothetical protein